MPLFSVVIPTFNRAELLAQSLATVFDQQCTDFEVVVVDDGSTDGTAALLSALPRAATVLRTTHQGPGAARNAGAAIAAGDYLAFLDSDDVWFPWTLAVFEQVIRDNGRPAFICGSFTQFEHRDELAAVSPARPEAEVFANYFSTWPHQFVIGAGMMVVRRDAFLEAGGFSSRAINLEDHDLSLRLGLAPGFVQVVAPFTMGWRLHGGGITRDLEKGAAGCALLIGTESNGGYPGGDRWASVRRNIITTHARSFSFELLKAGRVAAAWRVYRDTLGWHLRLRRLRYLAMFPVLTVLSLFKRQVAR